jgi:hypothetical protein
VKVKKKHNKAHFRGKKTNNHTGRNHHNFNLYERVATKLKTVIKISRTISKDLVWQGIFPFTEGYLHRARPWQSKTIR